MLGFVVLFVFIVFKKSLNLFPFISLFLLFFVVNFLFILFLRKFAFLFFITFMEIFWFVVLICFCLVLCF